MRNQAQQVIEKLSSDNQFDLKTVSAFTAPDFREGVQWLVQNEKHELAQALAEAGSFAGNAIQVFALYEGSDFSLPL